MIRRVKTRTEAVTCKCFEGNKRVESSTIIIHNSLLPLLVFQRSLKWRKNRWQHEKMLFVIAVKNGWQRKRSNWKLKTTFWCCLVVVSKRTQWRPCIVDNIATETAQFTFSPLRAPSGRWGANLWKIFVHNSFVYHISSIITHSSLSDPEIFKKEEMNSQDLCWSSDIR